jgi:cysteine desulfurase
LYLSVTRAILRSEGTGSVSSLYAITCPLIVYIAGAAEDMAHSSLRFGIGRFTTEAEVDYVIREIVGVVNKLREMR